MKKLMIILLASTAFASCNLRQKAQEPTALTVSEFILQAEQLENSTVNVIGQVDHLCMGSKAKIHFVCPEHPEENIKIFADENMKVFSDTLMGKIVMVTGKVAVMTRIDTAYLDEWEAELAAEDAKSDEENLKHADEGEEHQHEGGEEPEVHHHGNQDALIAKYRKQIEDSGKGYVNLYKIIVSEVKKAEIPVK